MPLNKSWHDYNELLIERGRVVIDVSFLKSSYKEIKKMNIGKVGAPIQCSDSYVRFLAFLKIGFKIPYRMVQDIVRGLAEYVKIVEEIHFTHIRKRIIGIYSYMKNVTVGKFPVNLAGNPVTDKIYVANRYDNTVSVIDGKTSTVVKTVPVGTYPVGVGINPVTDMIYVTN